MLKEIKQAAEECGLTVMAYSGRGMFGRSCLGISCETSVIDVLLEMVQVRIWWDDDPDDTEQFIEALKGAQTDSLGLGQVVYWPNISWEE